MRLVAAPGMCTLISLETGRAIQQLLYCSTIIGHRNPFSRLFQSDNSHQLFVSVRNNFKHVL